MKTCTKCLKSKELTEFHSKKKSPDGLYPQCKQCKLEKDRIKYELNKERRLERAKEYYSLNKEKVLERRKNDENVKRYNLNYKKEHKIAHSEYMQKYRQENKEKINKYKKDRYHAIKNTDEFKKQRSEWQKERKQRDPLFKLRKNLGQRLRDALSVNSWEKDTEFSQYIGCSLEELKNHLQSNFQEGMNWDNYGNKENNWSIDHIYPLSLAKTKEEMIKLCHYKNLQPLWHIDNVKKSNKISKFTDYEVKTISHGEAKAFLNEYHYLPNLPPIQYYYGLFEKDRLVGVCTYGKPFSPGIRKMLGSEYESNILELNRLALKNNKKNEASYLIANSMKMLPKESIVISFADPSQGHKGTIYKATNFKYYGLTKKRKNYKIEGSNKHPMTLGDDIKNNEKIKFTFEDRTQKHRYIKVLGSKGFIKKIEEMLFKVFFM